MQTWELMRHICSIFKTKGLRCQCLQWCHSWGLRNTTQLKASHPGLCPLCRKFTSSDRKHWVSTVETKWILVYYSKAHSKSLSCLTKVFSSIPCSFLSSSWIWSLWLLPSSYGIITPYLAAKGLCLIPLHKTLTLTIRHCFLKPVHFA